MTYYHVNSKIPPPVHVNFLDIQAQYPLIKDEILAKFDDIINTGNFVGIGEATYLKEFESLFSKYCDTKFAVAVSNGTNALWMILNALGIGPGDEVIVPGNTFIATAEAVSLAGATPVFADIKADSYGVDPAGITGKITKRTKAIIPVHMYGQCADMGPILEIAEMHKLLVIEDACQAHGAKYKGKSAGSMGVAAAFSFYPGKNLGAWGEGGAITTNDEALAQKLFALRNHGSQQKYRHDISGGNFRLDEFQSAVLSIKMKHIESWNALRRENAKLYFDTLKNNRSIVLPRTKSNDLPVWHVFVIRVKDRDNFMQYLEGNGIQSAIHYPIPLHITKAYEHLGYKLGDLPNCEQIQSEIVSLPMYAELTEKEIIYVCEKINAYPFANPVNSSGSL